MKIILDNDNIKVYLNKEYTKKLMLITFLSLRNILVGYF